MSTHRAYASLRLGWRSLRGAFASIWRIRSRATSNCLPTTRADGELRTRSRGAHFARVEERPPVRPWNITQFCGPVAETATALLPASEDEPEECSALIVPELLDVTLR
jgi:hypothetical protein